MHCNNAFVFGAAAFFFLVIVALFVRRPARTTSRPERFGNVLGAAEEFRTQYFNCLAACEKTDPTQRLSQNPWACGMYCDDIVAQSVAQGRNLGAFVNNNDLCTEQCKGSSDELACRAGCVGARNVNQYCAQQCDHSGIPTCNSQCNQVMKLNYAAGNSWFFKPT